MPGLSHDDLACLLAAAAAGDRAAFDRFYRETAGLLRYILRDKVAANDLDDVLQDTYAQAWRTAGTYDRASSTPGNWLKVIALSRGRDRHRRAVSHRHWQQAIAAERPELCENAPDAGLALADDVVWVRRLLSRLSPMHRRVVELKFFHALTNAQIAEILRVPPLTAKSRLANAKQRLWRMLAD